jgi:hypothetical protein
VSMCVHPAEGSAGRLTLEHHKGRSTNGHRCDLANVQQSCDGELANAKTHDNTSNNDDSLMVGIGNLRNAAEQDAGRSNPEDHLATPSIVDWRCHKSTKQVANVDRGCCEGLEG